MSGASIEGFLARERIMKSDSEERPLFAEIPRVAEAQPDDRADACAGVLWKKKEPQR